MSTDDPHELVRFLDAQRDIYDGALQELKRGAKRSHWMWFIFPQAAGLGSSAMAQRYAIQSPREAQAYLDHPVLGPRLLACANALVQVAGAKSAEEIMGYPDCLKLRSSMTLFAAVAQPDSPFQAVLDRYFGGKADPKTTEFIQRHDL